MNFPAVWSEIRRILAVTGEKRLSGISIVIMYLCVYTVSHQEELA